MLRFAISSFLINSTLSREFISRPNRSPPLDFRKNVFLNRQVLVAFPHRSPIERIILKTKIIGSLWFLGVNQWLNPTSKKKVQWRYITWTWWPRSIRYFGDYTVIEPFFPRTGCVTWFMTCCSIFLKAYIVQDEIM